MQSYDKIVFTATNIIYNIHKIDCIIKSHIFNKICLLNIINNISILFVNTIKLVNFAA